MTYIITTTTTCYQHDLTALSHLCSIHRKPTSSSPSYTLKPQIEKSHDGPNRIQAQHRCYQYVIRAS